jgi:uncharacterized protein YqeY
MTMSLIAQIKTDLLESRKARTDAVRTALLTTLSAEIATVGKTKENRDTTEEEASAVVRKFVKNAGQTLSDLEKAGRDTGAIQHELAILKAYLPAAPTIEELEAAIVEIVAGSDATGGKPGALRGLVMKNLKDRFGDRFDGAAAAPVVGRVLGA